MMNKIKYGKSVIQYKVVKSKRRKTSEIIVDEKGVEIRTPITKKDSQIKQLVNDKKQWIFKKQLEFKKRKKKTMRKKNYSVKYLKKRVEFFSKKLDLSPKKVNIKKLKSRWGSATKDNYLNFNSKLLRAPRDVIDYVVLHELCHLKIKEHNYRFWKLVAKNMPHYMKQKQWLEINSKMLL